MTKPNSVFRSDERQVFRGELLRPAEPRVAIIGAGFSGIAAAVSLARTGIRSFTVFERNAQVGGTWADNVYPGAEVDTPSVLYSFSFAPRVWSRTHVRQQELQSYLDDVVDAYDIRPHMVTGVEVDRVEWIEEIQAYRVSTADTSLGEFEVVVSAVGFLNIPRHPDWPGIKSFRGPRIHTSRWPADLDLTGKTVAVVGTGSTSAQVVPSIAGQAGKVLVFQREPGWVLPKADREYTPEERDALSSRAAQRVNRTLMLLRREKAQYRNSTWRPGTPQNAAAEAAARAYIQQVFGERPDLAEAVTPRYAFGGKRPVLSDAFYPALLEPNVELVPRSVARVTESGVVDSDGRSHDVDVLITATGFHTDFSFNFDVITRDGTKLTDLWKGEPYAFLGLMVPGVPNFFMMYGPNTNGGAIVTHLEAQARYVAAAVRMLMRTGAQQVEVRRGATRRFNDILQGRLAGAAFTNANNYYKTPSGRIVTQWSDGAIAYSVLTQLFRRVVWRTKRSTTGASTRGAAGTVERGSLHRHPIGALKTLRRRVSVLNRVDTGGVWTTPE